MVYGVGIRGRGQLALTHLAPVKLESFCTVAIFFVQSEKLTACTHAHTHNVHWLHTIHTAAYSIHTYNAYSCIQHTYTQYIQLHTAYIHTIHTVAYSIHTYNAYSCIQHTYVHTMHTATYIGTYIDTQRQVKEHKFPPVHTPQ